MDAIDHGGLSAPQVSQGSEYVSGLSSSPTCVEFLPDVGSLHFDHCTAAQLNCDRLRSVTGPGLVVGSCIVALQSGVPMAATAQA